jgi:hypothetical protein
MAGSGAAAILAFFGVDPKKVPLVSLHQFPLLPTPGPLNPRPLSRKGRGVKELGWPAATLDSIPPRPALRAGLTFLGRSPKNSPLFSAPKKPKKSLRVGQRDAVWSGPRS